MRGASSGKPTPIQKNLAGRTPPENHGPKRRRTNGEHEVKGRKDRRPPKNKCGADQPSAPHRSWISQLTFPPLGAARRWYWSDSAHKECHFYQYGLQKRDSENHFSAIPAAASCPVRSRTDCGGGRNARATGTHSRAFPNFPWQFTLENCQSATGVTAIIHWQALRIATYSLNPLCPRMLRAATEKYSPLVQKLCTM
jgi:hypothetical protein